MDPIEAIVALSFAWVSIGALALGILANFDLSIFNPVRNYEKWCKLNWYGVSVITLILNVVLFPYAFVYWMIYKLFTIGRK